MYLSNLFFFFLLFAFELDSASICPDMVLSFALYSTKVLRRTSSLIFNLLSCSFSTSLFGTTMGALGSPCSSEPSGLSFPRFAFFLWVPPWRALALNRTRGCMLPKA